MDPQLVFEELLARLAPALRSQGIPSPVSGGQAVGLVGVEVSQESTVGCLNLVPPAPRRGRPSVCVLLCLFVAMAGCASKDWRTASREPAGIAPSPVAVRDAVLQVYGASAWGWRGWFAVHTWIAAKPSNAPAYTVYEVIGWRLRRGLPVVRIEEDLPDRAWYGARPRLLREFRGSGTDALIAAVDKAARGYPWPNTYKAFPGPNSNTFTAWIGRQVPELGLELPFSAIGSGYSN